MYRERARVAGIGLVTIAVLAPCIRETVRANPVPDYIVYTHVQPVGAGDCADLPGSCNGLVQSTTLRGPLEFGVFLWQYQPDPYWPCDSLIVPIRWPAAWSCLEVDVCGTSGASFMHWSGGGVLRVPSLEEEMSWHWRRLLRVVLDVTSPGWFEVLRIGYCSIHNTVSVRAGLECGDCAWPCSRDRYGAAFPVLDPAEIELVAQVGDSAVGQIRVEFGERWQDETYWFTSSEGWLSLEARTVPGQWGGVAREITAIARAEGLAPGTYEDWIEAHRDGCSECARVIFTVREHTEVPRETWGSLKAKYR